ncbi:MAG TPA: DNA-binding domain-containing protein [Patescibacteria group bacterium]|nr:DNA-binding domain-containing protein [Patescibacteria group bacterium]
MTRLRDLQDKMMEKIQKGGAAEGLPIKKQQPLDTEQRLNIYKNNTKMILRDLINQVFPVTALLLGEKFMAFAADEFVGMAPPDSGDMNEYGAQFPEFLEHLPNLNQFAYVPDVARLEWLAQEAYLSPRLPPLTQADLAAVKDPVNMVLPVQPHLQLLRSGWPVDRLWTRVTAEGEKLKDFEMKPAETYAAIFRTGDSIRVWSITEGGYRFIEHLKSDPRFAFAAESGYRAEPSLALDKLLATLLQQELLVKTATGAGESSR